MVVSVFSPVVYAEESAEETINGTPEAEGIVHEEPDLQTASGDRLADGYAYAVLTEEGDFIFFRSNSKYENKQNASVQDLKGNEYTGTVYADFEDSRYTSVSEVPWKDCKMKTVTVAQGQAIKPYSAAHWFESQSSLASADLTGVDTSGTVDMSSMFDHCSSLAELNISGFKTDNVTDMHDMFRYCHNLKALDLNHFDTHKVADMSGMFYSCSSLETLEISSFNTARVTDMSNMFCYCEYLKQLDVSSFNTANVTDMHYMFCHIPKVTKLDLSNFNTTRVKDMTSMFSDNEGLTSLDLTSFNTVNLETMRFMFLHCYYLKSLDLSSFDTGNVTDMYQTFADCYAAQNIYVSEKWSTDNVEESTGMFRACSKLPNYSSASERDKTYAHYGTGGYLTYKKFTQPNDDEPEVTVENSFSVSSHEYRPAVNELFRVVGTYCGDDPDSFKVTCSDPDAVELSTFSHFPGTGDYEYTVVFQLKVLKFGAFDIYITNGDLSETIHVETSGGDLVMNLDSYRVHYLETAEFSAVYTALHPERLTAVFSDPKAFEDLKITYAYSDAEEGYVVSVKGKAVKTGTFTLTLSDGELSTVSTVQVVSLLSPQFTLERDNNSFIHISNIGADSGFYGFTDYTVTDESFKELTSNSKQSEVSKLKKEMSQDYDGACYGISATIGMLFEDYLDIHDLTDDQEAEVYYDLRKPAEDPKLKEAILLMQLSQNLKKGGKKDSEVIKTYRADLFLMESVAGYAGAKSLPVFLESLLDYVSHDKAVLLNFTIQGVSEGHTVLVTGMDFDQEKYELDVYDMNSVTTSNRIGTIGKMNISKDLSKMTYTDALGETVTESNYQYMSFCDYAKMFSIHSAGNGTSDDGTKQVLGAGEDKPEETLTIQISSSSSAKLVNQYGEVLKLKDGMLSGDMPVYGMSIADSANGYDLVFEVPLSNEIYAEAYSETIDVEVYGQSSFLALSATGLSDASLYPDKGIDFFGNGVDFTAFVSTDSDSDGECGLISVSAKNAGEMEIRRADTRVKVADYYKQPTDISATSYKGTGRQTSVWEKYYDGFTVADDSTITEGITDPYGVKFTASTDEIYAGEEFQFRAVVSPDPRSRVTWTLTNGQVASINSSGLVKGKKPGVTYVRAAYMDLAIQIQKLTVLFTDIGKNKYYFDPVYWAVENGITNGYTDPDGIIRTFKPENDCTREAVVTFLWRLAGKPEPKNMNSPFTDIQDRGKYYYNAVLWAAELGITKGYSDGSFRPNATCLREHVVTFLYRYAGQPEPRTSRNPFNDVKTSDYYYKAVLWANENGIANGYSSGQYAGGFGPKLDCLREHVVTFLYRYAK